MPADAKDQGSILLRLARAAIARRLGHKTNGVTKQDWLDLPSATFVTLTQHGRLRGCIGSLEARRPLGEDVEINARAAAFDDPRFQPLTEHELAETRIEVSILSEPEPIDFSSREDAISQLRPGIDGIIIEHGAHRATFLPQVWEQLQEPEHFLAHLMIKAGLPAYYWSDGIRLYRYTVEKFKEGET